MTIEELEAAFERHEDEFLKFDRIEKPLHRGAEHDQIWLDVDAEDLATVATDEMIRDLYRCGVRYDDDALVMFV